MVEIINTRSELCGSLLSLPDDRSSVPSCLLHCCLPLSQVLKPSVSYMQNMSWVKTMASCGFYPLACLWSAFSSPEVFFESLTWATCLAHGNNSQENPSWPSLIAWHFIACHPSLCGTLSQQLHGASCIRKSLHLNDFQQEKAQRSAPCQLVPAVYVRVKQGFCFNFLNVAPL